MIGVGWDWVPDEVLRWAYALELLGRGGVGLALALLLAVSAVGAWRVTLDGRASRRSPESPRKVSPVARLVPYSRRPGHGTPAARPGGTHVMT